MSVVRQWRRACASLDHRLRLGEATPMLTHSKIRLTPLRARPPTRLATAASTAFPTPPRSAHPLPDPPSPTPQRPAPFKSP
jgi:hypothetical protein